MTTQTKLRLGAVAFVLVVIFLLGGAHLCEVAFDRQAADPGMRPIGAGALACTEFWLNRYQTLIGALVAVGAAFLAYRGVKAQIASAEKQVQVGRRQSSIALLEVMNDRSGEVRAVHRELAAVYNRLRGADSFMERTINSLETMLALVDDPARLRDEYVERFERRMKSHKTLIDAAEANIQQASICTNRALISTDTKYKIEEFIHLARHSHAVHIMANQVFSEVVTVFDNPRRNIREIVLNEKFEEAKGIVHIPIKKDHYGYIAAAEAARKMADIIDTALKDAEGRSEQKSV